MAKTYSPEEVQEQVKHYSNIVPAIYGKREFPSGFHLAPLDWYLTEETIDRPDIPADVGGKEKMIRPIGTLDVEFLSNDIVKRARSGEVDLMEDYPCGLECPGCFAEEAVYGDRENLMYWQEMMDIIGQAKAIGLHSAKFLAPGELFQNPELFEILDAMAEQDLPFSIFTKGAELGNDELARKWYANHGIRTARGLVERISQYENVRILLGFNSLFPERQDKIVGSYNALANYEFENGVFTRKGVPNYTEKRDSALVNLTEAGFNSPENGQRLTLVAGPMGLHQIDEAAEMYAWTAQRNIPLLMAISMESGLKSKMLMERNQRSDPGHRKLFALYESIYRRAFEDGILTPEQVESEGLSPYIGIAPCNSVANGLYVRLNGQVKMCPGRTSPDAIFGNTHDTPLAELWVKSPNYARGRVYNNWCPAKTTGLPLEFKAEMERHLRESSMH